MALNTSGPISLGGSTSGQSINLELGQSATAQVSLNDTNVRTLAGVASGAITMPTNFYGKSTATSSGMYWVGTSIGQDEGLNEFTGAFIVPAGVTSLSAVCIGAGGNWQAPQYISSGGALAYGTFSVTPGETLTITVANMIAAGAGGGISSVKRGATTLVGAYSAFKNGTAGTVIAGTGGSGGTGGSPYTYIPSGTIGQGGGGGAGGYSGNGGNGGNAANAGTDPMNGYAGSNGSGGGGGGGGGAGLNGSWGTFGAGGGVGPFGVGSSGTGGAGGDATGGDSVGSKGLPGSNGGTGNTGYTSYFGGAGGNGGSIAPGAVRIITQGSAYPTGFNQITNEALITTTGAGTWTVPAGVTSISVCCMGGGGGGRRSDSVAAGGGGGGMRWYNNLTVTPGASINYSWRWWYWRWFTNWWRRYLV